MYFSYLSKQKLKESQAFSRCLQGKSQLNTCLLLCILAFTSFLALGVLPFLSAQLYIKTILKKIYPTFLFLAERLFKVFKIFYNLIFIWLIYQFLYRTVLKSYYDYSHVLEEVSLSHIRLLATPWKVAYQALPSMEFSRQEHWNGLPFPSP